MDKNPQVYIGYTAEFKRQIKRLKKKYASLQDDYANLLSELQENPYIGVELGKGIRKVRMAIASKGKGKSGGARVITYCIESNQDEITIDLLTIYDKSEIDNVSDSYIQSLIEK